jgi:hypothetical protein
MLLVLCSHMDTAAHAFVTRFAGRGVRSLTCASVSQQGWKMAVRGKDGAAEVELIAGIDGARVRLDEIEGVITRLGYVSGNELGHIVPEDRSYVAAEMHAFLFAFLEALPRRVVNPPSPGCLYGPNIRAVQWRRLARQLGIPVEQDLRAVGASPTSCPSMDVTVIFEQSIGKPPQCALRWTQQLAQCVCVPYLTARYADVQGGLYFAGVDTYPNIESEEIACTLLDCFRGRA